MTDQGDVPRSLRIAAAYGWRVIVLCAVVYVLVMLLAQLQLVLAALFIGLVVAALLSPWVRVLESIMPRPLAVGLGFLSLVAVFVGVAAFITQSVAGEWGPLTEQFRTGVGSIQVALSQPPFNFSESDLVQGYDNARNWIGENRGQLATNVLGGFGTLVEGFAVLALGMFSAVCFLSNGSGIWSWMIGAVPKSSFSRVDGSGQVAWRAFSGYTRGIIIVAFTNAVFVCILLLILGVPLALPLSILVFFGTFIPLVGAPIAMLVAVVVALAAKGPIIALVVLVGIALIGQFEGHVLHPLVMSKAVNLHPLAVALAVASGTLLAGLLGAVLAVPVISVLYGVAKFWVQTAPPDDEPPVTDPTGTGAAGITPEYPR